MLLTVHAVLAIGFYLPNTELANAWLDDLHEDRLIGDLTVSCRDSFNGVRITRAQVKTTRRLETGEYTFDAAHWRGPGMPYGIELAPLEFGD